ncbi:hypothetical protein V5O48_016786 [Marasmius crinis-equi]|uniref:ER-bound oxygenase mpaB/mpaB'/Rubber oxygenase catalytic domain-containing protein n=1 Tax=Marasmius crinis-equi TaxID=585013 RepID=A0ABR3EQR5_9AGAR
MIPNSVPSSLTNFLPWPTITIPALLLLGWVGVVRTLRWRRYKHIHRVYGPKFEAGMLTPEDAQEVLTNLTRWEMPLIMEYAYALALFKTYGIPTISKILVATKEFSSTEGISKRYADTMILIATWVACPISGLAANATGEKPEQDPRADLAIARTNWLHSHYPIKNDDYLYTLALFMFEPARWAARYGWRPLSDLENEALFIFWLEIGKRMNFKNLPENREDFQQWVSYYEDICMVPDKNNKHVAYYTTEELIFWVPKTFGLKELARRAVFALIDQNVRIAMMEPEQPQWIYTLFDTLLRIWAWQMRYLHLPRIRPYGQVAYELPKFKPGDEPLLRPNFFQPKPWYKPEAAWFGGWLKDWLLVQVGWYSHMPSKNLKSEGYRLDTTGPLKFEHDGQEETYQMAEKMLGCPIQAPWRKRLNSDVKVNGI